MRPPQPRRPVGAGRRRRSRWSRNAGVAAGAAEFERVFQDRARRDPRGYILSADQPDFLTATKFINALLGAGVQVYQATADFTVAGKSYSKNSYVVKSAQAFRAHVLDMFEPQDHPNDFAYPGGPPVRPYDSAGYTPAFQMAVKFDRVLDGFSGPFEEIKDLVVAPLPARVVDADNAAGFFLGSQLNDSFRAVNRLQKAGEGSPPLERKPVVGRGRQLSGGYVLHPRAQADDVAGARKDRRRDRHAISKGAPTAARARKPCYSKRQPWSRWDRYGGSMPSGWTRWLLEQFEFPFQLVYAPELDKGGACDKFDVS